MNLGGNPYTLLHLVVYTQRSTNLGFPALWANDHMVVSVPGWTTGVQGFDEANSFERSCRITAQTDIPSAAGTKQSQLSSVSAELNGSATIA
jgi:hypothetical protein